MSQTPSTPKTSSRERLLQLVARYHAANKKGTELSPADQAELESLVMSELKMPLDRAKTLLVHLVQYNEEEEVADLDGLEDEEEEE